MTIQISVPWRRAAFFIALALASLVVLLTAQRSSIAAVVLSEFTATPLADGRVRIAWRTETELNTAAFRVQRGLAAGGPFDVIVDQLGAQGDSITGSSYEVFDADVTCGVTYYYQLVEIERNGNEIAFSGDWIRSVTACVLVTATPTATATPPVSTSTPTATRTTTPTATTAAGTATATLTATSAATRTATPTATRTATPVSATALPTDPPTATRRFTNTPEPTPTPPPAPTATPTPLRTATARPPVSGITTPTRGPGNQVSPLQPTPSPAVTRSPTVAPSPLSPTVTPTSGRTATPTVRSAASPGPSPSTTPPVFTAKATDLPVVRATPTRSSTPAVAGAARNQQILLLAGVGAVGLAALLGFVGVLLWRSRRS